MQGLCLEQLFYLVALAVWVKMPSSIVPTGNHGSEAEHKNHSHPIHEGILGRKIGDSDSHQTEYHHDNQDQFLDWRGRFFCFRFRL